MGPPSRGAPHPDRTCRHRSVHGRRRIDRPDRRSARTAQRRRWCSPAPAGDPGHQEKGRSSKWRSDSRRACRTIRRGHPSRPRRAPRRDGSPRGSRIPRRPARARRSKRAPRGSPLHSTGRPRPSLHLDQRLPRRPQQRPVRRPREHATSGVAAAGGGAMACGGAVGRPRLCPDGRADMPPRGLLRLERGQSHVGRVWRPHGHATPGVAAAGAAALSCGGAQRRRGHATSGVAAAGAGRLACGSAWRPRRHAIPGVAAAAAPSSPSSRPQPPLLLDHRLAGRAQERLVVADLG